MSSIGYDFLQFDKPMFFLNANQALPLHQCGASIDAETFDFSLTDDFNREKKQLYQYTFEKSPHWKEEIHAFCRAEYGI